MRLVFDGLSQKWMQLLCDGLCREWMWLVFEGHCLEWMGPILNGLSLQSMRLVFAFYDQTLDLGRFTSDLIPAAFKPSMDDSN
jgi:hypothetical protein